jgi:alpha-beta hydrolase superfamily lysophospholipase
MSRGEGAFTGEDGVEISYRTWLPEAKPRAAVVISHGGGEHSGRYEHVAWALNEAGYGVWALDHRGHGRSGGERARFDSLEPLADDLGQMIEVAAAEVLTGRPFVLAHSMGGAVALEYACERQQEIAGLVLSGPLVVLNTARPLRLAAAAISRVAPGLGLYRVDSEGVSRDPEVISGYDADPLNFHGSFPATSVAAMDRATRSFPGRLPSLRLPLLIMHGSDDWIASPQGSRLVDELASSDDKTLKLYEGLRHEILNEPEGPEIVAAITAWLDARADGGGSG